MTEIFSNSLNLQEHCLKVSEITTLIKTVLEHDFTNVTVMGEISNFRPSSTGHWYFSLKDSEALLSAVMFKNRIMRMNFQPKDGMQVKVKGSISVYPQRGNYQLICESMEISGQGDIFVMLEKRKQDMARKGYFDSDRKRELPPFPSRVAVVTSPTGAAIRDILQVLGRRNAGINLIILPAPVQGEGAAKIIAEQIKVANLHKLGEVIIVARGGGSLEDMLPFYDEQVIKAIYESKIPVISAIGHEIDITFSDLAADCRAPTPSAAAELVSTSTEELLRRIEDSKSILTSYIARRLENIRLMAAQFKMENIERNFRIFIQPYMMRLDDLKETLVYSFKEKLKDMRHRMELTVRELESVSPYNILKRGYAVVTSEKSGKALTSAEALSPEDPVKIQFYKGSADAIITKISKEK